MSNSSHRPRAYQEAADRFGWSKRSRKPGQLVKGNELIGCGMATALYPANRSAGQAVVRILRGGKVYAASGSQELGTGTYTMIAQTAADTLGLDSAKSSTLVEAALGDSMLPKAPVSGGSQSTASVTPAVQAAAKQVILKLAQMAARDAQSPLHTVDVEDIGAKEGRLFNKRTPRQADSFAEILARNGNKPVEALGSAEP